MRVEHDVAQARILELEAENADLRVLLDLSDTDREEALEEVATLRAQIMRMIADRSVAV